MKLYTYFRSSAAYRVRIALNLKGIQYESLAVNLLKGEQKGEAFSSVNPQKRLPALDIGGPVLTQSPAILEYLDEAHPEPPLLPVGAVNRAKVRAIAAIVACDIHPLNNLRVLKYLKRDLGLNEQTKDHWYRHWILEGFDALEAMAGEGRYLGGDAPGIADCCLVPQMYNARRFDVQLEAFPRLVAIDAACMELEPFQKAHPDAVKPA